MKLSGWHRLWVVACAWYLAAVAAFVTVEWPTPERVSHRPEFYGRLAPESRKIILDAEQRSRAESSRESVHVEFPNGHVIAFSADVSQQEGNKVSREYWSIVEEKASQRKRSLLLRTTFLWLIPCVGLYALGWSVAWVVRGFRDT